MVCHSRISQMSSCDRVKQVLILFSSLQYVFSQRTPYFSRLRKIFFPRAYFGVSRLCFCSLAPPVLASCSPLFCAYILNAHPYTYCLSYSKSSYSKCVVSPDPNLSTSMI
ncbi:hypothetical protein BOTBODRAFT_465869 [Botryobasidium botryosum FD-172 SS1]|uniref:Uncharacterized protein n=1 Tax=Botryobasidium botryosum (strain FD-172 SS1) TaxID=930990 RepID=A0A067MGS8_BOTB1|nr:hypothetical protein BOTBODRAFT_465869 [Botryobasidium botryosum FD-172 SS1]